MREYSLDDKYVLDGGWVYMTGIQALVRLPIEQMRRDRRAGLKTGTWISGYEGSPLGGYDLALERVRGLLDEHNIHFLPGVNEDLAATSVMGSQVFQALPDPQVDGVVGIWYGKGPGVDRSGDVLRHANLAGTGKNCGALALAGDDHGSKSSTIPHQSELSFYNFGLPTLHPGNTQEVLDYGLYGIALSRYAGVWAGMKLTTDVCDGGGTVLLHPEHCRTVEPELMIDGEPYQKVMNPLLIVPNSLHLEKELRRRRLLAAREFAGVNGLNEIKVRHQGDRLGIVSAGKAYYDLRSALANLGLDDAALEHFGVRILKLAMVYPLAPSIIDEFVEGLDEVLVIEEKRSFIELQLRELLYNRDRRPAIYGKNDRDGSILFPSDGELDAEIISKRLAERLLSLSNVGAQHAVPASTPGRAPTSPVEQFAPGIEQCLAELAEIDQRINESKRAPHRAPSYCSGCPHNRSTLLLEGQIAGGGIGCHGMAARFEGNRGVAYLGHMGGEGAAWIGAAPFSGKNHIFQNVGDGTYVHSGRLGVAAAVASGVNITFKILYNDVVAMTGGQDAAGKLTIPAITRELEANGVRRIVLLTDDLSRYKQRSTLAKMTELRPRDDIEEVLADLEATPGTTAMIYDQMCAAEKRRRRNRGLMPQPVRRIMINERVCEGCGDCVTQSNCVSLHPVETEYGPKTRIHQSSCNADYTCAMGDCPSFVSVMIEEGSGLKKKPLPALPDISIAEPAEKVAPEGPYHILMPGVGGTGVVTINALLSTAAFIEGKHIATLDQTGLAQKGGAVVSHLTISTEPIDGANRISQGSADLVLGFDVMGAAGAANLRRLDPDRTAAVVNSHEIPTGDSIRKGLTVLSTDGHFARTVRQFTDAEKTVFVNASKLAESLFGGHVYTNVFLVGVAYQAGLVPLDAESIKHAIRLNGVKVERNLEAFRWGRQYHQDPRVLDEVIGEPSATAEAPGLDRLIESRAEELTRFQNSAYAGQYRAFVAEVRVAEQKARPGSDELAAAVARYLYKLMAYKDEYEVARLLTDPAFDARMGETFEAPVKKLYHLHPPTLRALGWKRKLSLGPWFGPFLRVLARLKGLRGTPLDPFGWVHIRREERALIDWYREVLRGVLLGLSAANLGQAVELARIPDQIRGYEQIKLDSIAKAREATALKLAEMSRQAAA